ncbi:MAG: hypothetical protein D4R45_01040 [Planctomycetaceae bacterium]|nr:MAG: hypothetical protein D4R45_01040 [Planctomycetaceae bacterium]
MVTKHLKQGESCMNREAMTETVRERARRNHLEGCNCGESIFRALLETLREANLTDMPLETVTLAAGLGGGIGSSGNTCCAIIGGCMGIGIVHGRKDPLLLPTPEARRNQLAGDEGLYRLYNNFVFDVKKTIGSTSCAELTCPYDYYSDERKQYCRNIIGEAAALAMKWIFIGIDEGYRHPFNYNIMGKK